MKKMTISLIRGWIKDIEKVGDGDSEAAHGEEDSLLESVLEAIAKGAINPQELAMEALKVKKLEYDRYYS